MVFIKTTFALYFAAIALAAPTPQVGIPPPVTEGGTLGGAGGLINGVLGVFNNAFAGPSKLVGDIFGLGATQAGGGGGRLPKHVGDTDDQVHGGAPVPGAPGIPGSTD